MELIGWGPFIGACGTVFGVASTLTLGWLKNRREAEQINATAAEAAAELKATAAIAAEQLKASPYEALAARVVTLETSDSAKHTQIVNLSSQVMTLEATSETRRVLLLRAREKHLSVVTHVDTVEAWIEEREPGAPFPRLDLELRNPVATA